MLSIFPNENRRANPAEPVPYVVHPALLTGKNDASVNVYQSSYFVYQYYCLHFTGEKKNNAKKKIKSN